MRADRASYPEQEKRHSLTVCGTRGHMKGRITLALTLVASSVTLANEAPKSYADAKAIWEHTFSTAEYQKYVGEFTQFNNHYHLDTKGGCYALAPGPVHLMLIITHKDSGEFALIELVLSDVDNAKARCFENTYRGIQTKIPPFLPFILQMTME